MRPSRIKFLGLYIGAIACTAGIIWLAAVYGESWFLQDQVVPSPGTRRDVWLADFNRAATYGIFGSVIGTLLWYICTDRAFGVQDWKNAGGRGLWAGIGVLTVILCTALSSYLVPPLRVGTLITHLFFLVNASLVYYLVTLFATPPSYKYSPPGAYAVRSTFSY